MKDKENELLNKIIFKKFKIIKLQEKGNFSKVYLGKDIKNNKLVALKIQEKAQVLGNLEKEAYYLFQLKGIGIPKIISFGHYDKYNILVEELLGKSLEQLFKENKDKPKTQRLKDMLMVGIQIIDRLKFIHSKYILHLDIKPSNFLVGNPDTSIIYIIDFGFAKKYRSSRTGKHINFSKSRYFSGNLKYSSVNTMKGIEPSRRDDLESLGYMLIYLYKGELPWDIVTEKNRIGFVKKLYDLKKKASVETICKDLPIGMKLFMEYVKALKFEEQPNYDYLTKLLENILQKINKVNDLNFSWINGALRNKISRANSKSMRRNKVSPFSKIINAIEAKTANKENSKEKSEKNSLNNFSLNKYGIPFNNAINNRNNILNKQKTSYSSKLSPVKQINIKLEEVNNDLKNKMKNKNKNKYILNHNLNLINNNSISSSLNNSENGMKNEIIGINKSSFKCNNTLQSHLPSKLKTRNKVPRFKSIIQPIINNQTINIYANDSSQINVSLNQSKKKKKEYSIEKEKLKTVNCKKSINFQRKILSNYKTKAFLGVNKNLIKKFNFERKNTIIKLDNYLCSDIIYNKKFKNN